MLVFGIVVLAAAFAALRRTLKSKNENAIFYFGVSSMLFFAIGIYLVVFALV